MQAAVGDIASDNGRGANMTPARANILTRRGLAYNKNLPQDVADVPSTDGDFPVRIRLCEYQLNMEGEVVLGVFFNWKSVAGVALRDTRTSRASSLPGGSRTARQTQAPVDLQPPHRPANVPRT